MDLLSMSFLFMTAIKKKKKVKTGLPSLSFCGVYIFAWFYSFCKARPEIKTSK